MPEPCLVRSTRGFDVSENALTKEPPALHQALGRILDSPNSDQLLLGLNELFGGASQYAISGSTALALQQSIKGNQLPRMPNDLDVVVSSSAMYRLSNFDHNGLAKLGFECQPGNKRSITWLLHKTKPLQVDVIKAGSSFADPGFANSESMLGTKVISLPALIKQLKLRLNDEPEDKQVLNDLAKAEAALLPTA